ncbi:MAG: Eco57I restriction-modification methylase domain-containing protein [Pseudonocardia sp.]
MSSGALVARELGARGSRASVDESGCAAQVPGPAAAVLAVVPRWWAGRAAAAGLSGRYLDVFAAIDMPPLVMPAVEPRADIGPAMSGEELGSAYVAALTPQVRARHGRHYTPADLAAQLWGMTRAALGHTAAPRLLAGLVRDPACGAGALLLPPLREHLASLRRADAQVVLAGLPAVVEGVDTDPAAVWLAGVILAAEALPVLAEVPERRRRPLPALVSLGDGLAASGRRARAVVMNPPYGRVRLDPAERARFARVLYGHANLYGLFLAAGLESLDDDGVLSALVPTSFTAGRYFANLRQVLAENAPLRDVTFIAERGRVFTGVLQETCLATFSTARSRRTTIASCNGRVLPVATVATPRGAGPWLLPRRCDDAQVAAAAVSMPLTLAAAGWRVSTGPLVWNRRREDLHATPGAGRLPVLWAADIDGGTLHRDRARDALRYLQPRDDADVATLTLREPAILVQRTTAPEQIRRLVAVELTAHELAEWGGRVVVENHVNVLRPACALPAVDRTTLARVLATPTMDRLMRCLAGSVAVSAYELEALPLPDADVLAKWQASEARDLDAAVAAAYGPGQV